MQIVVKKFGGTSLANVDCIHHVANVIEQSVQKGEHCVVVVSAMAGTTNQLESWALSVGQSLGPNPDRDMVLCSGEMITAGLLAMALQMRGVPARSWTGAQIPIVTTENWGCADAVFTGTQGILANLEQGIVPIVCGFQGVTPTGRLTTLGRGGSDTTAVILSAALQARVCEIFTDVQGVYSADPAYVKTAAPYPSLSYASMRTLSQHGAKVLHPNAIILAEKHQIPIHVLSTTKADQSGTWIRADAPDWPGVVYRQVLSWHIDRLPDHAVHSADGGHPIDRELFVDWRVSAKGVHFLTWVEDYHRIRALWPLAVCSDPKMLVSFIGHSPEVSVAMTTHGVIRPEHCIYRHGMMGVMIPQEQAYDMVRHVHQHLEQYAKLSAL